MSTDTVGGVWTYSLELSRALALRGFEIALATMGKPPSRDQRVEARRVPNLQIYESSFKLEWMAEPWTDVDAAGEWLLELEQVANPDIVHLNGYSHAALPWSTPVLIAAHSCVCTWWRAVHNQPAPAEWNHYRQRVTAGLQAADLIVAPSRAMLKALTAEYNLHTASVVISNGRAFPSPPLESKEQLVLSAGRLWDKAKNVAALDDIARDLSWPVYLAGEEASTSSGSADGSPARRLGRLPFEELLTWLGRASIYALPAKYEPFGLSVLEAALSGCALVLGKIDSLQEIWGDAALYVDPEDARQLAQAIEELIAEPVALAKYAGRARATAARYSPRTMAMGYSTAYNWLSAHAADRIEAVAL